MHIYSVQFSCSVVFDSLWPREQQHTRLPCMSPNPGVCWNSWPSVVGWWCHLTISSSVIRVSSHPQSFPASESFLMSKFFASGGQSIGASSSVLPMTIQDWFPLGSTGLISLQSKGSQEFSSAYLLSCSIFTFPVDMEAWSFFCTYFLNSSLKN